MHLQNKEPYALATLVLAGLSLLTKRLVHDAKLLKQVEDFLRLLLTILPLLSPKDQHPMTCAQFVVQCYDEAGYALPVGKKTPQEASAEALPASLAELTAQALEEPGAAAPAWGEDEFAAPQGTVRMDSLLVMFEFICCGIVKWLQNSPKNQPVPPNKTVPLPKSFTDAAACFAHWMLHGTLVPNLTPEQAAKDLKELENIRYAFVSPGDLLRCAALETKGVIPPNQ